VVAGIANNAEVTIGDSSSSNCTDPKIVNGGTGLTCTIPSFTSAGTYSIKVKNPTTYQEVTAGSYETFAPSIATPSAISYSPLNPSTNPTVSERVLTLNGTFNTLGQPYTVKVGAASCPISGTPTSTSITCNLPVQTTAGTYSITVTDKYNQTATLDGWVTYVGPPTVSSVSPTPLITGSSYTLTISGTFNPLAASNPVTVGANTCSVIYNDTSTIQCIIPSGPAAGNYNVKVKDKYNQTGVLVNGITYEAPTTTTTTTAAPPGP
jgi:hypothetical protein